MGFFDWFRGLPSNASVLPDVIWFSKSAKFAGITNAVVDVISGPDPPDAVLLVGHFADTLIELRKLAEDDLAASPVAVVAANDLHGATAGLSLDESRVILIAVGERHPLSSHDDSVADFARALPCRSRLVRHVSLDEPLLKAVLSERIEGILKRVGLNENEAIESAIVTRQIRIAQVRLAGRCRSDLPAESAEAWIEKNCDAG